MTPIFSDPEHPNTSPANWKNFQDAFSPLLIERLVDRSATQLPDWFVPLARGVAIASPSLLRHAGYRPGMVYARWREQPSNLIPVISKLMAMTCWSFGGTEVFGQWSGGITIGSSFQIQITFSFITSDRRQSLLEAWSQRHTLLSRVWVAQVRDYAGSTRNLPTTKMPFCSQRIEGPTRPLLNPVLLRNMVLKCC
jgi:hypothetical protein